MKNKLTRGHRSNSHDDEFEDFLAEEEGLLAKPGQLHPMRWYCARCGESNETLVDPSAAFEQEYVEDCAVCCHPNMIFIKLDKASLRLTLRNELA